MNLSYVFTEQQIIPLNLFLQEYRNDYPDYTIVIPCEIKNNLYILPYLIFDAPEFSTIKNEVQPYLVGVEVRYVQENEYYNIPIPIN
jgi:hypothetical protein